ncbi:DUF1559 domain-containing protein [Lignipirellula cremea]|uniref:DUF1559 domain-containing protein n=1 Tax=Lignipirellula cremea TaxID=2528010 RepID=A0A518DNU1_9BACT|nr:DUF1559 domain-containing protein [Lignipirellula cremea]QDU93473.1 hypothetical protein Pla8534_12530 [Lignipirellula cremea]
MHRFFSLAIPAWLVLTATPAAFAQPGLNTRFIPAQAFAAVVARPQAVLERESLDLLPREIITAAGMEELGFDPAKIEQITGILALTRPLPSEPETGVIVTFSAPYQLGEKLTSKFTRDADGKRYRSNRPGQLLDMVRVSDTVLLAGTPALLETMVETTATDSPLIRMMTAQPPKHDFTGYLALESLQTQLQERVKHAPPLPPPLQPLLEVPDHLKSVMFITNLKTMSEMQMGVQLTGYNAASTDRLAEIADGGITFAREMILSEAKAELNPLDAIQAAMAAYMDRMADTTVKALEPQRRGDSLVLMTNGNAVAGPMLVAMLLPAIQQARQAARRVDSSNNLREIVLAMHNYHDTYRKFPAPAIYSEDGKPLLSWRVAILPYLEETALYQQFHLDEPWDSEHNLKLAEQMPAVFAAAGLDLGNKTVYQAVTGPGTAFEGTAGQSIAGFTDGTSNTILLVETDKGQAVEWTKPGDYLFDNDNPNHDLGGNRPEGFLTGFADGSVRVLSPTIDQDTLRNLLRRNDGNVVGDF